LLCNYMTHAIYHLPMLSQLDMQDVSTKANKDITEVLFVCPRQVGFPMRVSRVVLCPFLLLAVMKMGFFCEVFVAIHHFCHQLAGITRCPSFFLYSPRLLYRGRSITLFTLAVRRQYPDDKDVTESLGLSREDCSLGINEEGELRGQPGNPGKWLLKQSVCVV